MVRYVFDCETNGLLHELDTVHSLVLRDIDDGDVISCSDHDGYESMKKQAEVHRKGRTKLANLREAVNPEAVELFNKLQKHQTLPTPSAMEHKATAKDWNHQSGHMLSSIARRGELSPPTGKDMFLNPAFVEEMMGYPIGWLV